MSKIKHAAEFMCHGDVWFRYRQDDSTGSGPQLAIHRDDGDSITIPVDDSIADAFNAGLDAQSEMIEAIMCADEKVFRKGKTDE